MKVKMDQKSHIVQRSQTGTETQLYVMFVALLTFAEVLPVAFIIAYSIKNEIMYICGVSGLFYLLKKKLTSNNKQPNVHL